MGSIQEVKEALSAKAQTTSLDELRLRGRNQVRLIRAEHIAQMVAEAVERALADSGLVPQQELQRIVERGHAEFAAVKAERQRDHDEALRMADALRTAQGELAAAEGRASELESRCIDAESRAQSVRNQLETLQEDLAALDEGRVQHLDGHVLARLLVGGGEQHAGGASAEHPLDAVTTVQEGSPWERLDQDRRLPTQPSVVAHRQGGV